MDRRITLQSITRTADSQGGFTETWADVATVYAQIKPIKGYERFQFAQNETLVSHEIISRYRAGITTKMRLTFDDRVFYIKEVLNIEEANAYLKIIAMEMA